MLTFAPTRGLSHRQHRISPLVLVVVLVALLVVLIPTMPRSAAAPRAQPELVALAQQQPESTIGVIVQKNVAGTDVEQRVAQLGGTITLDLHIINAFAAQLTGQAALALAQTDGVRWV